MKIKKLDFELSQPSLSTGWLYLKKIICHFQVQIENEEDEFEVEINRSYNFTFLEPINLKEKMILRVHAIDIEKKYKLNPSLFKDKLKKLVEENPTRLEIVDDVVKFK